MEDTARWFCPMQEHLMQCSNPATCKGYQQDSCMALSADEDDIDHVWTPEIYVENQVDTRGTTITDRSVMVYNNGYVFRERRFIWTLSSGLITQGVLGVPRDPFAPPSGPPGPSQDPVSPTEFSSGAP